MLNPSRSSEPAAPARATPIARRGFARLVLAGIGALALAPLALAPGAQAQSRLLDAPRTAGLVAERYDGFAAVRGNASPEIAALVAKVNAERRAIYAQRAASDNVSIAAVGKIYAVEIMKSAPPNTWFLTESGKWIQK